jgi:hypothetical protein
VAKYNDEVNTLYDNFLFGAKKYPKNKCLGARKFEDEGGNGEYHWQTYEVRSHFLRTQSYKDYDCHHVSDHITNL